MKLKWFFVTVLTLSLFGCGSYGEWVQTIVPKEEDAFARQQIELIRIGDLAPVSKALDPSIRDGKTDAVLNQIHEMLDQGELIEIEPVGVNSVTIDGKTRTSLTYQLRFTTSWALANVTIDRVGNDLSLMGFYAEPLNTSLAETNSFSLSSKSVGHLLFLAIVVLYPLFLIFTIVLIFKSKAKHKWAWIAFAFVGICQLSLNWTTGDLSFQPIYINVPGFGASRPGVVGPWQLFITIPIGVLVFLTKRKQLNTAARIQTTHEEDGDVS